MLSLQFDRCKWIDDSEGTWFMFRAKFPMLAKKFVSEIKNRLYVAEIKVYREKRSLDANAYFWELAGKLAATLQISPDEVYRQYIPNVAENYVIQPVREDMIEHWDKIWCSGHVGRMTDDIGECKRTPGYHNIRCYLGSSDFDTAQMSRLIDLIVTDCKENGIETETPEKLERLKGEWNA